MPSLLNPCDPDRLRRLAEDRLPPVEVTGLERHLERCARCREALDRLVEDDRCLLAVRRYLGDAPCDPAPVADESLHLLAPSDWPDSLGRIGNYEIKGVLGRGGMGVVLKAFDPALHRNVAIKVLSVPLATSGVARRRFLREARAAAAVVHEHVVAVYAVVESSGLPFLVMEYIPGRSLQERLDSQGALSLREVLRIGMQTASGLAAAHAQGLVHRDVKPANILLEDGIERVRLTDFGLARAAADAAMTHSGIVAGTPHYMAPEQARGETTDPRADLFSLGSTLYAACVGHPPFRAESPLAVLRRVSDEAPRPLREQNPDVPAWLETIIARLMAKDPARRFQTASEVADVLGRCLAHVQQPLASPLPDGLEHGPTTKRPGRERWRSAAVVAFATLLTLAGGALVVLSRGLAPVPTHHSGLGTSPSLASNSKRLVVGSPRAIASDDLERLIDEAEHRVRTIRNDILAPRNGLRLDRLSERTTALSQATNALERELLSSRATQTDVNGSRLHPKPHDRKHP